VSTTLVASHTLHTQRVGHVVGDIEVGEESVVLKHQTDAPAMRSGRSDIDSIEHDLTRIDIDQTGDGVQQSCFATATWAVHCDSLAPLDVETSTTKDDTVAPPHREINDVKHECCLECECDCARQFRQATVQ
jgi:hypothetical protein